MINKLVLLAVLICLPDAIDARSALHYTIGYQHYNSDDMGCSDCERNMGFTTSLAWNPYQGQNLLAIGSSFSFYSSRDTRQEQVDCMCYPNSTMDDNVEYYLDFELGYKYHLISLIDNTIQLYVTGLNISRFSFYEKIKRTYDTGPIEDLSHFPLKMSFVNIAIGFESRYSIKPAFGISSYFQYHAFRAESMLPVVGAGLGFYYTLGKLN